jgi:hypothetical protein
MVVFVSYARRDAEVADLLRQDIERAKRPVWIDRELTGGQVWWETSLSQIRGCSLFVFALSPESLRSKACMAELHYALALGRPLLPVMVRDTSVQLAPPEIGNAQIVDYRQRNADSAFALVNALVAAPPPPALPELLPPPPLVPMSYMNTYREQVEAEALSYHDQASLYLELRGHLQDEDGREAALGLLRRLRQRRDIVESVGRDIDTLLANVPDLPEPADLLAPEAPATPQTAPGWYPDPTRRYEQRYWDGTTWTDNVARGGQQFRDAGQQQQTAHTGSGPTQPAYTATASHAPSDDHPFDTGTLVLLHLASVFCTFGLVGVIAGFMNMNKPARRSQAMVLLIVGFVVMGIVLLSVIAASSSTNSDF